MWMDQSNNEWCSSQSCVGFFNRGELECDWSGFKGTSFYTLQHTIRRGIGKRKNRQKCFITK